MGKILKYKKYDEFGDLIIETTNRWYIAEIQNGSNKGTRVKRYKPGHLPKKYSDNNGSNLTDNPKFQSNGFDKRPHDTKIGNRVQQVRRTEKQEVPYENRWTLNQRDCLKKLLQMNFHDLVAYYVVWNMGSVDDVLRLYGEDVGKTISTLDSTPPTTIQILSLRMVLRARDDAKLAMNIMEMIEGKAVTQKVNDEMKQEKAQTKKEDSETETFNPVNAEMNEMLRLMKEIAFTKDEVFADWEEPEEDNEDEEPKEEYIYGIPVDVDNVKDPNNVNNINDFEDPNNVNNINDFEDPNNVNNINDFEEFEPTPTSLDFLNSLTDEEV